MKNRNTGMWRNASVLVVMKGEEAVKRKWRADNRVIFNKGRKQKIDHTAAAGC